MDRPRTDAHGLAAARAGTTAAVRRLGAVLRAAPDYPADESDRRTIDILGLRLPVRATIVILVTTVMILLQMNHSFLPREVPGGRGADDMRALALERLLMLGLVPLLVVLLMRDDPRRYGLQLGSWRLGLGIVVVASAVMTPIILIVARVPEFRDYYAVSAGPAVQVVVTNIIDLMSAEFLFRGFLMFALLRIAGPIGVVAATFPFVITHFGKPELETFSTLGGGLVFGWINWRTGSILYSGLFHVWILSLVILAAGGS